MVYAITGHSYNCMLFDENKFYSTSCYSYQFHLPFWVSLLEYKWSYEQVAWNIDDDIKA